MAWKGNSGLRILVKGTICIHLRLSGVMISQKRFFVRKQNDRNNRKKLFLQKLPLSAALKFLTE